MKYLDKLLGIFCIFVILYTTNGVPVGGRSNVDPDEILGLTTPQKATKLSPSARKPPSMADELPTMAPKPSPVGQKRPPMAVKRPGPGCFPKKEKKHHVIVKKREKKNHRKWWKKPLKQKMNPIKPTIQPK
ncbi:hypothetical protein DOY81_006790 [Sarcophaga bullata]|nr:hypothetical protein DOY81_006790 [Sarcophaga bullata]